MATLQRLSHGRVNVREVYKIIDLRVETPCHGGLVDDFFSGMTDHRNTEHFFGVGIV
jgi:hypothetical protein